MRIQLTISILVFVLLSLSACKQSPDCLHEDVFCAALVTDTKGLDDYGMNRDTWAGLEQSKADGMIDQIAYIESVDTRDYEKNIAFFVDAGYDVIVTSGIGLREATLRSADLYPDSVFIGMNQREEIPVVNFISVTFAEDQMGFFAGALAARLTRAKFIGAVCETSGIDSMWRYCEGFRAGAKYVDDSVKAIIIYRDNGSSEKLFIDEEWGFENAQSLVQEGTDVIFAAGGETGVGALHAAVEAKIRAIGVERDQGAALGEEGLGIVTSIMGDASFTVQELMRRVRGGNLADAGMSPIGYVPLDSVVQKGLIVELDEILAGLATREVKTNVTAEKP